jgi:uncharacterized protein (DUF1330 family)
MKTTGDVMPAYVIAFVDVTNPTQYAEYTKHTPRVIAELGGKMIVRGGAPEALEGELPGPRCVVIEFPDRARATAFYHSPAYTAIKALRAGAGTGNLLVVDGYPTDTWTAAVAESSKHG